MWRLELSSQWERDQKWYEKKRPNELAAVLRNLRRYLIQLNATQNHKSFTTGYMHPEPHGIVAIDQRGGGCGNLQETRLYVYPEEVHKVLYIITIGNKDEQQSDIQFCNQFVESLKP